MHQTKIDRYTTILQIYLKTKKNLKTSNTTETTPTQPQKETEKETNEKEMVIKLEIED
jgi:hypothetical protein